jgi:hypothetical protein
MVFLWKDEWDVSLLASDKAKVTFSQNKDFQ